MLEENYEAFFSVDEDEEEERKPFVPTAPKYRSCTLPNASTHRSVTEMEEKQQAQQEQLDSFDRRTATEFLIQTFRERFLLVLMLGGLFILGLYIFVLC